MRMKEKKILCVKGLGTDMPRPLYMGIVKRIQMVSKR